MKASTFSCFTPDGALARVITGGESFIAADLAAWDGPVVPGEYDPAKYWHDGSEVAFRPACPVELDGMTLRGVRPESTIIINRQSYDCAAGGDVELEFDQIGTYRVRVVCWPYLDGEFEIENPAQ